MHILEGLDRTEHRQELPSSFNSAAPNGYSWQCLWWHDLGWRRRGCTPLTVAIVSRESFFGMIHSKQNGACKWACWERVGEMKFLVLRGATSCNLAHMKPITQICFHAWEIKLKDKARLWVHLIVAGLALCSVEDKDSTSSDHSYSRQRSTWEWEGIALAGEGKALLMCCWVVTHPQTTGWLLIIVNERRFSVLAEAENYARNLYLLACCFCCNPSKLYTTSFSSPPIQCIIAEVYQCWSFLIIWGECRLVSRILRYII